MNNEKLLLLILELASNIVLLHQEGMLHNSLLDIKLNFLVKSNQVIEHDEFISEEQIKDLKDLINSVIIYE